LELFRNSSVISFGQQEKLIFASRKGASGASRKGASRILQKLLSEKADDRGILPKYLGEFRL
jgi:hypothetical protein